MCLTMRPTLRVVRRALPRMLQVGDQRAVGDECEFAGGAEFGLAQGQIGAHGEGSLVAQRDVALLAALALDQDGVVLPLDVGQVDADQLGVADAAAVEQFEDHAIALGPRGGVILRGCAFAGLHGVQQAVDLFHAGHAGKMLAAAWAC